MAALWVLAAGPAAAAGPAGAPPTAAAAGRGTLNLDGRRLHVSLVLPFQAFPGIDADGNRIVTRTEVQAASARVAADVGRWFGFSDGRQRVALQAIVVAPEGSDGHAPDGAAAVLVAGFALFDAPPARIDAWLQDAAALPAPPLVLTAHRRDADGRTATQVQPLGGGITRARFFAP